MSGETQMHIDPSLTPHRGYADVQAEIISIQDRQRALNGAQNAEYFSLPPEVTGAVDSFGDDYDTAYSQALENDQPLPAIDVIKLKSLGVSDAFVADFVESDALEDELGNRYRELDIFAPEKAAEVLATLTDIESRIDYPKMAAAMIDDAKPELNKKFSLIAGTKQLIEAGQPLGFTYLASTHDKVLRDVVELQGAGYMLDNAPEHSSSPDAEFNIHQFVEAAMDDISTAASLTIDYRSHDIPNHPSRELRWQLLRAANFTRNATELTPENVAGLHSHAMNQAMMAAVNAHVQRSVAALPARDYEFDTSSDSYAQMTEQARNIDALKAAEAIEIEGNLGDLPFEFDADELRDYLMSNFPALALENTRKIDFRPLTKEEDKNDTTNGLMQWDKELGGGVITISDAKVKQYYAQLAAEYPDGELINQAVSKEEMLEVIAHEVAHVLHTVLPVAALKRWHEMREKHPTNVTAYVKERFDAVHVHRYQEDFAESIALYTQNPAALDAISEPRFVAVEQIFEEFMPDAANVKKARRQIIDRRSNRDASVGKTKDDIRATYLAHENVMAEIVPKDS
jgi:hypothetical protein